MEKYNIHLPDRELACAPFNSPEGQRYFSAMKGAANFAWANRQLITFETRKAWGKTFTENGGNLSTLYDVAHNIVKLESYKASGETKEFIVHRKGATRAFPKGHSEMPDEYRAVGQPVLIPGSMGTSSYVLVGQQAAMELSFGSGPHGAGRTMSRSEAKRRVRGSELKDELEKRGISIAAGSLSGLAEEAPIAYKDVGDVVEVVHQIGIAKQVAKLVPVGVMKG